jgi:hypothetical protein
MGVVESFEGKIDSREAPLRPRSPNPGPNDHTGEIADMLATPPLGLESHFDDPSVRCRIGECISQAMHRPLRHRRKQRGVDERLPSVVKLRVRDR